MDSLQRAERERKVNIGYILSDWPEDPPKKWVFATNISDEDIVFYLQAARKFGFRLRFDSRAYDCFGNVLEGDVAVFVHGRMPFDAWDYIMECYTQQTSAQVQHRENSS